MDTEAQKGGGLPLAALEEALEAARSKAQAVREQIERLESEERTAAAEERLLEELLALREGTGSAGGEKRTERNRPSHGEERAWMARERLDSSHPVVDEVLGQLEHEGRPLHISEIMRVLGQRQVNLPGAGTQANVISHLRRDERISRPSRGIYALAKWKIEEEEPKLEPQRRRRKRVVGERRHEGRVEENENGD